METINISSNKANDYVCLALNEICDLDNVEIIYTFDEGKLKYELIDTVYYEGQPIKRITNLSIHGYLDLLKYCLNKKGFNIEYIKVLVNDNETVYRVFYHLLEKGYSKRRKR